MVLWDTLVDISILLFILELRALQTIMSNIQDVISKLTLKRRDDSLIVTVSLTSDPTCRTKGAPKISKPLSVKLQSRVITSILTVLSGNTGNISPRTVIQALPSDGLLLLSSGLYFLVLPSHPVNIGLI